ncbi:hypothetical protein A9993_12250 [Rahnella victoriana]|nr:hypothetical protein A9993_12250 [Rahnella victoriana]
MTLDGSIVVTPCSLVVGDVSQSISLNKNNFFLIRPVTKIAGSLEVQLTHCSGFSSENIVPVENFFSINYRYVFEGDEYQIINENAYLSLEIINKSGIRSEYDLLKPSKISRPGHVQLYLPVKMAGNNKKFLVDGVGSLIRLNLTYF